MARRQIEVLLAEINIRSALSTDSGLIIEGIANDVQRTDEHETRFSFSDDCIRQSAGHVVLLNHGVDDIAGVNLDMERNKDGSLWVRDLIDPTPRLPNGMTYVDAVRKGYLNKYSIRFDRNAKVSDKRDYWLIEPTYLPEHSLVSVPSNRTSNITTFVRSLLDAGDEFTETTERYLSELGRVAKFSRQVNGLRDLSRREEKHMEPEQVQPQTRKEHKDLGPLDLRTRDNTRAGGVLDYATLFARLDKAWHQYRKDQGVDEYSDYSSIHAIYDDVFIVREWRAARLYSYTYSVDDQGNVEVTGGGQEVIVQYVPVNVGQQVRGLLEKLSKADDETIRTIAELTDASETVRGVNLSRKAAKWVRGRAMKMRALVDEVEAFLDADESDDTESRGLLETELTPEEAEAARKAALERALGEDEQQPAAKVSADELLNIVRSSFEKGG